MLFYKFTMRQKCWLPFCRSRSRTSRSSCHRRSASVALTWRSRRKPSRCFTIWRRRSRIHSSPLLVICWIDCVLRRTQFYLMKYSRARKNCIMFSYLYIHCFCNLCHCTWSSYRVFVYYGLKRFERGFNIQHRYWLEIKTMCEFVVCDIKECGYDLGFWLIWIL